MNSGKLHIDQFNSLLTLPIAVGEIIIWGHRFIDNANILAILKRSEKWKCIQLFVTYSVVSNSLQLHELYPARLLCSWDSPGRDNGVGSHSLFQGIFLTQRWNWSLLPCRQILYHLSYHGNCLKVEG